MTSDEKIDTIVRGLVHCVREAVAVDTETKRKELIEAELANERQKTERDAQSYEAWIAHNEASSKEERRFHDEMVRAVRDGLGDIASAVRCALGVNLP